MLRVTTEWSGTGQGQPWFSTHHFAGSTTLDGQDAVAALGVFWSAVDALISTTIAWQVLEEVEVINEVNGDTTGLLTTAGASGIGATTATAMPWASQGLVRWRTGTFVDGREIRGRTYIPGLTISSVSGGSIVPAHATTIDTAADGLIINADTELLVWQRPRPARDNPPLPARDGSAHLVVTASVWNEFATLRSRRD